MALGTAPTALVATLQDNWQVSRTGRDDVPDVVRDSGGDPSSDPADVGGGPVLIFPNRDEVATNHARHDLIHCYQPEANPPVRTDQGYDEQRITESVQIDIDI